MNLDREAAKVRDLTEAYGLTVDSLSVGLLAPDEDTARDAMQGFDSVRAFFPAPGKCHGLSAVSDGVYYHVMFPVRENERTTATEVDE